MKNKLFFLFVLFTNLFSSDFKDGDPTYLEKFGISKINEDTFSIEGKLLSSQEGWYIETLEFDNKIILIPNNVKKYFGGDPRSGVIGKFKLISLDKNGTEVEIIDFNPYISWSDFCSIL